MSPADWLHSGFFFPYKQFKIFYRQHRTKNDCILLLHGFPTSSWDWRKVWDDFAKYYRVVAPDFLGLGFSDKPLHYRYSIFDQADMIEYLISEVGSIKFHILAHDYGATVAQELVARYHAKNKNGEPYFKIQSVCFLNGGLFPEAYKPLPVQKLLSGMLGNFSALFMNQFTFERSFNKIFGPQTRAGKQELTYYWHIVNYNHGKRAIPRVIQYMHERKQFHERWTAALQKTDIPLRLINGPEDPISGTSMVNTYRELIPNPDVVLLEGIGHYPHIESPARVTEAYFNFLGLQAEI
ncbi:MAG TPA: alpha/beta hydrolase [Chitinophagales bacterium]|nr:alpha/beta hydrolase [Chitinophagales bacterium]